MQNGGPLVRALCWTAAPAASLGGCCQCTLHQLQLLPAMAFVYMRTCSPVSA